MEYKFPKSCRLRVKDKIYYPSETGMALICAVVDKNEEQLLVEVAGKKFFLSRESVDRYALAFPDEHARIVITQRLEDPENRIVYLRHLWRETLLDRVYNWYCRLVGRYNVNSSLPPAHRHSRLVEDQTESS